MTTLYLSSHFFRINQGYCRHNPRYLLPFRPWRHLLTTFLSVFIFALNEKAFERTISIYTFSNLKLITYMMKYHLFYLNIFPVILLWKMWIRKNHREKIIHLNLSFLRLLVRHKRKQNISANFKLFFEPKKYFSLF